jgi:hypothetical protein
LDAINDITISSSVLSSSVQCIMRSTSCPFLLWVYTCQGPTPHLLCALTQHIPNHSYRPKQTAFSALIPWQPSMMPLLPSLYETTHQSRILVKCKQEWFHPSRYTN